jgi:hypothetical protein
LALMPGTPRLISLKRRGPYINSRNISGAQRSPISSSAKAMPQASSYQRLGSSG